MNIFRSAALSVLLCASFCAFAQVPAITSFSPTSGPVATVVTINGSNFALDPAANTVYFGYAKAKVLTATENTLTVAVPNGSYCKPLSVTNAAGLTGWSGRYFNTIYTNNAYGFTAASFKPKQDYPIASGTFYSEVATADFNGDGKPEMVALNTNSNRVSVFKNISTPDSIQFAPKVDYSGTSFAQAVSIGDFDGDGKLDFVVSNGSYQDLTIFRNISSDSTVLFQDYISINTGLNPGRSTVADFDGDGKPDIAFVNGGAANVFSLMRNLSTPGSISFAPRGDYLTGITPVDISVADFNEDNKTDIVVVNQSSNTASVFINRSTSGNISFDTKVDLITGQQPQSVATGDLVGNDGRPDILTSSYKDSSVSVIANITFLDYLNFRPKTDFGTFRGIRRAIINDFDGDGRNDICTVNANNSTVSVLKNTSINTISFLPKVDFATGNFPLYIASADLNMDGKPEILSGNSVAKTVSVLPSRAGEDAPFLTSFKPVMAAAGTPVLIKGKNLGNTSAVKFGGTTAAIVTIINDSSITASPATGASGAISVASAEGLDKLKGFVYKGSPLEDRLITTIAGNGTEGYNGDSSTVAGAVFNHPSNAYMDTARGYLYIDDAFNLRIRRLNINTGNIVTVAGNGSGGADGDGGPATAATLYSNRAGLSIDKNGNLYFVNGGYNIIRKVDLSTGIISRIAGGGYGDANADNVDPLSVSFSSPTAICFTSNGDLYFTDQYRLRKIEASTGLLKNVSANVNTGSTADSIDVTNAVLPNVYGMAVDKNDNIYFACLETNKVKRLDAVTKMITTVAGSGIRGSDGDGGQARLAELSRPWSISLDTSGKIVYLAENSGSAIFNRIRMIDLNTGIINTIAGGNSTPTHYGDGGGALAAGLYYPSGITTGKNNELYFTEDNGYIRKLEGNSSFVNLCEGGNTSFTPGNTGNVYQWQINTGAGFVNAVNSSNIAGANSALLQLTNVPATWSGYAFRCMVDLKTGRTYSLKFENIWTGAADSSWENIANWSCNSVPDASTNVVINAGQVIVKSNALCRSLSVKPAAKVTVQPGFKLTVTH